MPPEQNALQPLLAAKELVFAYPDNPQKPVLRGLSLQLFPGESLGLAGRNGCGKTTLFRCLTGLARPKSGTVIFAGVPMRGEKDFRRLRREIGYVLQDAEDQILFPTVLEDLAFGPLNLGLSRQEAQKRAAEALALVGLEGFEQRLAGKLSGGEKKLEALAAILAMRPRALLLDEPTNDLDEAAVARVEALLLGLECAKIVVSHDRAFLQRTCGRVLTLQNGLLAPGA